MPLKDHFPVIDDRRFNDIVDELRARIPRYTTEWTDTNESDVGWTLVELFAWLSEMLLFRLGQVPKLNYLKFLELIGIELIPAAPARALITFPVQPSFAKPLVTVPARTQVTADAGDGGGPVIFETERTLTAFAPPLAVVQSFDGYTYADVSQQNGDAASSFQPFSAVAAVDTALLLGFNYVPLFPQGELSLAFWLTEERGRPMIVSCDEDVAATFSPVELAWEYWDGAEWRALTLIEDQTRHLSRSGVVTLRTPKSGEMTRGPMGLTTTPHYWLRVRINAGAYDQAPSLLAVRTNTVAATQAQTVEFEILGGSDGSLDQTFTIANAPILAGTLKLEVDEGSGFEPWTEVADFFASGEDDPHYLLDRATGEVRFGGRGQRIPVANVRRPNNNIRARIYRWGGGLRGNLPAGAIRTLLSTVPGIDMGKVSNLFPAGGGGDEETLDEAIARAPRAIKSQDRAVTVDDFEAIAREVPGVRRAKALPLYHPKFPTIAVPGVVSVIVVPDSTNPMPMPSEALLNAVCAKLNTRRLLTTEVYVIPPTYVTVSVAASLIAQDDANAAEVQQRVEAALLAYFHPLTGGEKGTGWPFGESIFYSSVYRQLLIEGVRRVESLTIFVNGKEQEPCRDVPIPRNALVTSEAHEIAVDYEQIEAGVP